MYALLPVFAACLLPVAAGAVADIHTRRHGRRRLEQAFAEGKAMR